VKLDLVIDFYRKFDTWPLVAWGLRRNLSNIHRVIIVNDELWNVESRACVERHMDDIPYLLLDHPHDGFGSHRSTNQGMNAVTTEYWSVLNSDIVLTLGSLAASLEVAAPEVIVYPHVHDIPKTTTSDDLDAPTIIRPYGYAGTLPSCDPWARYRDCHTVEHTASSLALGGRSLFPGYGYIDNDYGCRWALEYGLENIRIGYGVVYDPGECLPHERHVPHPDNTEAFKRTLALYLATFGHHV